MRPRMASHISDAHDYPYFLLSFLLLHFMYFLQLLPFDYVNRTKQLRTSYCSPLLRNGLHLLCPHILITKTKCFLPHFVHPEFLFLEFRFIEIYNWANRTAAGVDVAVAQAAIAEHGPHTRGKTLMLTHCPIIIIRII